MRSTLYFVSLLSTSKKETKRRKLSKIGGNSTAVRGETHRIIEIVKFYMSGINRMSGKNRPECEKEFFIVTAKVLRTIVDSKNK